MGDQVAKQTGIGIWKEGRARMKWSMERAQKRSLSRNRRLKKRSRSRSRSVEIVEPKTTAREGQEQPKAVRENKVAPIGRILGEVRDVRDVRDQRDSSRKRSRSRTRA